MLPASPKWAIRCLFGFWSLKSALGPLWYKTVEGNSELQYVSFGDPLGTQRLQFIGHSNSKYAASNSPQLMKQLIVSTSVYIFQTIWNDIVFIFLILWPLMLSNLLLVVFAQLQVPGFPLLRKNLLHLAPRYGICYLILICWLLYFLLEKILE